MGGTGKRQGKFAPSTTFFYIQSDAEVFCRKAYWIHAAIDRERFQMKVEHLQMLLAIPFQKRLAMIKDKNLV